MLPRTSMACALHNPTHPNLLTFKRATPCSEPFGFAQDWRSQRRPTSSSLNAHIVDRQASRGKGLHQIWRDCPCGEEALDLLEWAKRGQRSLPQFARIEQGNHLFDPLHHRAFELRFGNVALTLALNEAQAAR